MIPMSNRNPRSSDIERANQAYSSDAESGIAGELYSSRPPSSINHIYGTNSTPYVSNVLNTTAISYDLYGTNAPKLTTRYDLKSHSSVSLYGSRKSLPVVATVDPATIKQSQKVKFKNFVLKKLFSDDDSYAEGEYEQNDDSVTPRNAAQKKKSSKEKDVRENWAGKCDFFLSCLGYAVGLGAVWRFPYLCYKNGGGVFLIPYLIFLFLVGIPLFFLELNLGQYTSQGAITCWKMAPIFKGLGISMNIASALLCIYYNMIIAYSLYYLFLSFRSKLDWSVCDYAWATKNCTDDFTNFLIRCDTPELVRDSNGVCYAFTQQGRQPVGWWNMQKRLEFQKPVLASQDYWDNFILQKSTGINNGPQVVWQLALCLLAAWVIVFLCVFRGIKQSGKVVYFTAVFPYVVLLILGIFGWTLPGSGRGVEFYMKPDVSKLANAQVWFDAAAQIFFIMSTSYGGLITLASYNKFNRNTLRDTLLITISNAMTSIFAGFVVFGFVGYLAYVTQQDISSVITPGMGLSFVIFPFAVTKLAGGPFWSILFFVMMITLGLDSEFATLETVISSIIDVFPRLKKRKLLVISALCISFYLLGLPYCTRAGKYWIELMDHYATGWAILIIAILECACIGWVYGIQNFKKDVELMIGKKYTNWKIFWFWGATIMVISPCLLITLVVFSLIQYKPLQIDNYVFPYWANVLGWLITAFILSGTVFWTIYIVLDALFIKKRPLKSLFKPEADWGPARNEDKFLAVHLPNLAAYHHRAQPGASEPSDI